VENVGCLSKAKTFYPAIGGAGTNGTKLGFEHGLHGHISATWRLISQYA
jgi:hypothetical protein